MLEFFPLATSNAIERLFNEAKRTTRGYRDDFHYPINTYLTTEGEEGKATGVIIESALAGFSRDEVKVVLEEGNKISISVEPKEAEAPNNYKVISTDISRKRARVSFTAAVNFDSNSIKVTFENGLLHIEAPFMVEKINRVEIPIP